MASLAPLRSVFACAALALAAALAPPLSSSTSAASYTVPTVSRMVVNLPPGIFGPDWQMTCLLRLDADARAMCYDLVPPPVLWPAYHETAPWELNGGQLTLHPQPCSGIPGSFAISVDLVVSLDKGGGTSVGDSVGIVDTVAPFDCQPGPGTTTTTGPLTLTPLAQSTDTDGDGCSDYRELGSEAYGTQGGLRDPFNPYDTWDPAGNDRKATAVDIFYVVRRFASHDSSADRTWLGPNKWNMGPGDGTVTAADIWATVRQFGTSWTC